MTPAARLQAAVDLVAGTLDGEAPADALLTDWFRNHRFAGSKDRRAIQAMVWRAIRRRARLTWWIARVLPDDPGVDGRRLVLADLVAGENLAPDTALGYFNGARYGPAPPDKAERRLARRLDKRTLVHPDMPDPVRHEAPAWLWERLVAARGEAAARAELDAMLTEAPMDLRANALHLSRDALLRTLHDEGVDAAPTPLSPLGVRLSARRALNDEAWFRDGRAEVQDEGSQIVSLLADARPGHAVCDLCAGAGGKALALAAAMNNKGRLVACDVLKGRVDRARTRLRRAGVHNAEARTISGTDDRWVKRGARFDRVLADVPCTNTGTWRRRPDARWRLAESEVDELAARQAEILDAAAGLVKPGGLLVYATCSLLTEENDARADAFLANHPDFEEAPADALWRAAVDAEGPPREAVRGGRVQLTPARHGTDGFFAAVFRRRD